MEFLVLTRVPEERCPRPLRSLWLFVSYLYTRFLFYFIFYVIYIYNCRQCVRLSSLHDACNFSVIPF